MELATEEAVEAYRHVYNPPEPPIDTEYWPGSTYNARVGEAAEQETWEQYIPNELHRTLQAPYDGIIATRNGKALGCAEDLRQVQVKTRTWEKKSGGTNYYNITLPSHDRMASDGFYHFWIHSVTGELDAAQDDQPLQVDLDGRPLDPEEVTQAQHPRDNIAFHGDAVFTWEEIDSLISYAQESYEREETMTGIGFSADSRGNPRVDIAVPLMFDYKDALETAHDVYEDETQAQHYALRRIDDTPTAQNALETLESYSS